MTVFSWAAWRFLWLALRWWNGLRRAPISIFWLWLIVNLLVFIVLAVLLYMGEHYLEPRVQVKSSWCLQWTTLEHIESSPKTDLGCGGDVQILHSSSVSPGYCRAGSCSFHSCSNTLRIWLFLNRWSRWGLASLRTVDIRYVPSNNLRN